MSYLPDIDRMEAVNIFGRVQGINDGLFIKMGWQGQLHKQPIYILLLA